MEEGIQVGNWAGITKLIPKNNMWRKTDPIQNFPWLTGKFLLQSLPRVGFIYYTNNV